MGGGWGRLILDWLRTFSPRLAESTRRREGEPAGVGTRTPNGHHPLGHRTTLHLPWAEFSLGPKGPFHNISLGLHVPSFLLNLHRAELHSGTTPLLTDGIPENPQQIVRSSASPPG